MTYAKGILDLEALGVLLVFHAGNEGFDINNPDAPFQYMGDNLPQALGEADDNTIAVGAVKANGKYAEWTAPEGCSGCDPNDPDVARGSVTIWAQGEHIQIIDKDGNDAPKYESGTSFASPQVAGLLAYLMSLPENADLIAWDKNGPEDQGQKLCQKVKQKLLGLSYERWPHDKQIKPDIPLPYPVPQRINVAYNGAWGPQAGTLPWFL